MSSDESIKNMIDTTIILYFLCPLWFVQIHCGRWRFPTILTTHHPPLCQPNHDKPLAAPSLAAFGPAASGLASSRQVSFQFGYAD